VAESPSALTESGKRFLALDSNHPGSLGIAISEAVEAAVKDPKAKYSLGSVLDGVLLHQTVIGLEADKQLRELGAEPDIIIGCVGGGSNFSGISFPFIGKDLRENKKTRYIAVEPEVCPTLTGGELRYDHGDSVGLTPLLFMHTLGMEFVPPPIHAGGPLVSHLVDLGVVEPRAYSQDTVFSAARTFFKAEGILPAPESSHAIAAVIDEALKAKKNGEMKVILFNLSGHGFLDISAYNGSAAPSVCRP
jgi:tryptophan synthase beta chain